MNEVEKLKEDLEKVTKLYKSYLAKWVSAVWSESERNKKASEDYLLLVEELEKESSLVDGFKELAYHKSTCSTQRVWSDIDDECSCGYDQLCQLVEKQRKTFK